MQVDGRDYRSIWRQAETGTVTVIDQTQLPHRLVTAELRTLDDAADAIARMVVRGAPLIGATAAYGMALAATADPYDAGLEAATGRLIATRPTAVNLRWAVERLRLALQAQPPADRAAAAWAMADALAENDVLVNKTLGRHGLALIQAAADERPGRPVQLLTHCNAGWLAAVDWGTATAPIYAAHAAGIPVHVWVDETRPRNQGASLTAWELAGAGIPHTVIVDNAGGHVMQAGGVDLCIVGTDRTTAGGDVANKIGTYLKALAARDNAIPFYVAAPSSSIDWSLDRGVGVIEIEERAAEEVSHVVGLDDDGRTRRVRVTPVGSAVANPGFDVTPARLVTGLITERGVVAAERTALAGLFPDLTTRSEAAA